MCSEISIVGGVGEMVRAQIASFFVSSFFFQVLCIINHWEQRLREALAMAEKKLHPLKYIHPGTWEKAINPSPYSMRPIVHQPCKTRYQTPTKGAE